MKNQKAFKVLMIGPGRTELESGGVVTVIEGLMNELQPKYEIEYIVTMRPENFLKRLYIYVLSIVSILRNFFIKKKKIAHVHMSSRTSFYRKSILIILLKMMRIPVFIHLHAGEFHIFYEDELNGSLQKFVKYTFGLADRTILLTNSWQEWYCQVIKLNNSIVVYNGVKDYYNKNAKPLHERDNIILFLGKIGKNKGIFDLLYAFKIVVESIPDATLLIGGDGEIDNAKNIINDLKLENNVNLLGWIDDKTKFDLLNQSKVYILPSYNEGLPMGILEAMSAGLGIVTTAVGGIPEAVTDDKNGLIVTAGSKDEIAKAIETLLTDDKLLDRLGHESRLNYNEKFNLNKISSMIDKEYSIYAG